MWCLARRCGTDAGSLAETESPVTAVIRAATAKDRVLAKVRDIALKVWP